jgi:outer membrane protein assembly factor BamB
MTTRSNLTLAMLAGACLALAGCGHLPNPFASKGPTSKYKGTGERIPVIALNDTLRPSDALKGQEFYLPPPEPVADWPLPGGTPAQSVEHVDAGHDLAVAWRERFGKGTGRNSHVTAPPVAADGKIFVMDGAARVSAYELASGRSVWREDLSPRGGRGREAFGGGLAYADGKLYVSSGYRFVAALDGNTGHTLWRTPTDAPVHDAPTVSGGRVFAESTDDNLLTFDAATGATGWTYQGLSESARILAASSPAVSGEAVVTAFASGELVALQASNGNGLWTAVLSRSSRNSALSEIRDIPGRPVIYKGDVFAVSHSGVFDAVDLRTGAERWSLPVTSVTTPWAAGDVVYVTDTAGDVICVAREGGQVYWITDLNKNVKKPKDRAMFSGPVLASNRLLVVSTKGLLVALDPKTGAVQRSIKIGSGGLLSPIAANGYLYVATEGADLIAIR